MKKLLLLTTLAAAIFSLNAADVSTNASAGLGGLISGRAKINSVFVLNSTTNSILVHLFDAPGSTTTYTNAAYTVIAQSSPSSTVTTYTNIFGTVENWTNTAITSASSSISAATNTYPKLVTFDIAGSSSATWTPSSPVYTVLGLLSSNSAAVTINVNYNR